jgi:hypothetical protein
LEIQQTAIRQLTTEQESAANTSVTPASTVTPDTAEATKTKTKTKTKMTKTPQSLVVSADGDDSESEAEQGEATNVTPELPKPAEVPVTSVIDAKKAKVSCYMQLKICVLLCWVW